MKETDVIKMEFLITLNDNIVIQRYFNVRGYNPMAKSSLNMSYYLKDFVSQFEYDQKMRSVVYLLENQEQIMEDQNVLDTSNTSGPEIFNFYIKVGEQTICHRIFDGKMFPPKVRYTVDVRPFLKDVLRELTDIFSENKLTYDYLDFDLSK